ncbi:APC amino acid permease [Cylindrobasidium torrendii FP15055 ss-10]|uniref:APC amino acid permease n=1 Tax=Cylindrobasidium torrendii FP15055 ss-10 TaxID=1314674 RepID=A0A0D7BRI3_9AGAR|nr:APC amino acid permease [Cylindrobasidium torrendii FP15055 ss-10]
MVASAETEPLLRPESPRAGHLVPVAVHREDEDNGGSRDGLGEEFDNVPKNKRSLGLFSASSLVFNRIVGTGIFATPSLILRASGSVGMALLMWVIGATIASVGTAVYIELGTGLPRSGGEKNYLEYIYRRPAFLATCVFAVYAVITGSSAANSLVFSEYTLHALGLELNPFNTRLVAFVCLTFVATTHGTSVRFGVALQNTLGIFKLALLSFFAFGGLLAVTGLLPWIVTPSTDYPLPEHPFRHPFQDSNSDVSALVSGMYNVIWSFVGYSTANYALSEVRNPIRTIKRAAPIALAAVTVVYILVNVAYFAVVEKQDILSGRRIVAALFFRNLFGEKTERVLSFLIAFSTLGNLLSGQFSQGRVLQELGREGIIPFSSFFASTRPFGGPLAALSFQWVLNVCLMLLPPQGDAYLFMISLSSYCLALINVFVALGLLLLSSRISPYPTYRWDPPFRAHKLVVVIFLLSNIFLVTIPFVPPGEGSRTYEHLPYYAHALTACGVSLVGTFYWFVWSRVLPNWKGYRLERHWVVGEDGVGRNIFQRIHND